MKNTIRGLLAVLCLFFTVNTNAQLTGSGTASDPYLLSNENDLNTFRDSVHNNQSENKHFKLTENITVSAEEWTPVGIQTTGEFKGTLDGNGKVISGIRVNASGKDYQGFIGYTNSACIIKNLGLDNVQITGRNYVGALGGRIGGTVTDCFATNITITGNNTVGGLIGHTQTATAANPIRNCHAQGSVSGNDNVGGLLGYNSRLSVSDSSADVSVSGSGNSIGGLIGSTGGGRLMTIEKCWTSGDVTVSGGTLTQGVGGLIGKTDGAALAGSIARDCYTTGNITATAATGVGGIFGYNDNAFDIKDSYASGNISGYSSVGGIAGLITSKNIENCVALNAQITATLDDTSIDPSGAERKIAMWGESSAGGLNSRMQSLCQELGVSYFNGGQAGQLSAHTLARLGSRRALMDAGTIPASGSVVLTTPTMSPQVYNPFSCHGSIAGVAGTLSKVGGGSQLGFTFTRDVSGTAVSFPAGTPFIPTGGEANRNGLNIIFTGKNDLTLLWGGAVSPEEVLSRIAYAYNSYLSHAIVIGHWVNEGEAANANVRTRTTTFNTALSATYGNRFIDLHALLMSSEIWTRTGITPTAKDLEEQALGNLAPSLASDSPGAHLAQVVRDIVVEEIKSKIEELGYFLQSP